MCGKGDVAVGGYQLKYAEGVSSFRHPMAYCARCLQGCADTERRLTDRDASDVFELEAGEGVM
jgi:hypothetical protein